MTINSYLKLLWELLQRGSIGVLGSGWLAVISRSTCLTPLQWYSLVSVKSLAKLDELLVIFLRSPARLPLVADHIWLPSLFLQLEFNCLITIDDIYLLTVQNIALVAQLLHCPEMVQLLVILDLPNRSIALKIGNLEVLQSEFLELTLYFKVELLREEFHL